jgi:hypothetical protein
MSRSAAPPNSTRAVPVPAIYYALIGEIERMRRRYGIPMWKLDEAAGSNDGYFAKALHCDSPSGRIANWMTFQRYVEVLFPEGFAVVLKHARPLSSPASEHKLSIRFSGARYDVQARRDWMAEISKRGASKGGKASAAKLTPTQRKRRAKHAAKKRWSTPKITEITDASTGT